MADAYTRLVHISDLHVAHVFRNFYRGVLPLNAHHFDYARALATRVEVLRSQCESDNCPFRVVATGDLTVKGDDLELDVASTFLRGSHFTDRFQKNSVAVRQGDDLLGLPGNHDVWGGFPPLSFLPVYSSRYFPNKYPFEVNIPGGPRPVAIIVIDSTWPLPGNFAVGLVGRQQLAAVQNLASQILRRDPNTVLVAALHHSLGTAWYHKMLWDWRRVLRTLVNSGVKLVICGHDHQASFRRFSRATGANTYISTVGSTIAMGGQRFFRNYDFYPTEIEITDFEYSFTSFAYDMIARGRYT